MMKYLLPLLLLVPGIAKAQHTPAQSSDAQSTQRNTGNSGFDVRYHTMPNSGQVALTAWLGTQNRPSLSVITGFIVTPSVPGTGGSPDTLGSITIDQSLLTPAWANVTGKPSFSLVATSGDYNDLSNKPSIPASQVNSDWSSVSRASQILNKPTLGSAAAQPSSAFASAAQGALANTALQPGANNSTLTNNSGYVTALTAPVTSVNSLTGAVTLTKASIALGNVDNTTDLGKPISTATQTALNTKEPTIPTGSISQFYRGDKSWTSPSIGDVTGLTAALATKFNTPSGTAAQYVRGDGSLQAFPANLPFAPVVVTAARALNTGFQVSTTSWVFANYSVDIATVVNLVGGQVGTVFLEYADNNTFTTNLVEVARFVNGQTGTLVVGLTLNQTNTGTLTGYIPPNKWVRIRTANTTGTPTFNIRSGQELTLN